MKPYDEARKIQDDITRLEKLKQDEVMPADLADASIAALQKQLALYQAQLEGDGSIAQGDNAKAVGKGSILIEGGFQGNVYVGEQPEDDEQALRIYRRMVMRMTSNLPLRGIDIGVSDATHSSSALALANVYVDLDTKYEEFGEKDFSKDRKISTTLREKLSVLEAVSRLDKVVILGDPGSGKSTFVNFLAYCLSANALEPSSGWIEHLKGWPEEEFGILPIVVILRDFVREYTRDIPQKAEVTHIWNFIEGRLKAQNLERAAKPLRAALDAGKAILLFDGLDEVPTEKQRIFVRDALYAFISRYDKCRYLITCRVLSYQPPAPGKVDLRLPEFLSFEIAGFDKAKIARFVEAWYIELVRLGTIKADERDVLTTHLDEVVNQTDLARLASNPLLLTVIALVHTHKGRLPDARALLYEETIDILLWRWEQIKMGGSENMPSLRQYLIEAGRTDVDLKRVIWSLAFEANLSLKDGGESDSLADINEHHIVKALSTLKCDDDYPEGDLNWAQRIVDLMKMRAGLLLERQPGIFTFPHRTFQEYLAGAHLAGQNNFAFTATELTSHKTLWREVILYAVGKLVYVSGDLDKPLALVAELCRENVEDNNLAWWRAWLAGDVLQEIGLKRASDTAFGRDLVARVQLRLKELLEKGKLKPRERNNAGLTLSNLGDPRFNPDLWYLPADEMLGFALIPAGKFLMGSDADEAKSMEKPQHELTLPDFWIAKYLVTVAQFHAFAEVTKYPWRYYNNTSTQPIVGVAWYDALEYTKWLDKELHSYAENKIKSGVRNPLYQGLVENKLCVTLPSEAEWEKAARGTNGRVHPWKEQFELDKANTLETNIGEPSVVGCFPKGASEYGLLDMGGNVWEWTRSIYTQYPYKHNERTDQSKEDDRVLRGGSFSAQYHFARCTFRFRSFPSSWDGNIGFRVAISPVFPLA